MAIDGFTQFILDTAAIQSNSRELFPMNDAYERDAFDLADVRDEAASVTTPCDRCHALPAVDSCDYCGHDYCEGCLALHECTATQMRDGRI